MTAPLLSEADVAHRWACDKSTIRRLRTSGRIPYIRFGNVIRYRPDDIATFEADHAVDTRVATMPRRRQA